MNPSRWRYGFLITWLFEGAVLAEAPRPTALETAAQMVRVGGASGGVVSVVGATDAELALALAKQGRFVVHVLCADRELCDTMRETIRAAGMYGAVSANVLEGGRLPYTDNLINLVVVDSYAALAKGGPTPQEVLRVLAPLGTACVGTFATEGQAGALLDQLRALGLKGPSILQAGGRWVCFQKPWPADIDEWTHYLHGADGNPVAQDRVVGPPRHYQWIAEPLWLKSHETDSSVSTVVTARGRLFAIVDEAPNSVEGATLPDKWSLVARDAFNGVLLWKVPIRRWGWREWKDTWFTNRPGDFPLDIRQRLVAVGDKVYVTLGYRAPVSELDARTGEVLQTYAGTEGAGEILYHNGKLILPVFVDGQLKVVSVDAGTGKLLWASGKTYRGSAVDYVKFTSPYADLKAPYVAPAANAATDGKTVALLDGTQLVGLDFRTGAEKWHASFPTADADRTAGGANAQDNLWNGTMIVSDGVVPHASPAKLAAFDGETGKLLWAQPKKYIGHLWYEWKEVFVIEGLVWTWSAELDDTTFDVGGKGQHEWWPRSVNGDDLKTGALKKEVPTGPIFRAYHHHRCYRNKATVRYLLASRRGTEYVDLEEGKHTVSNWVRGTCHVGQMPANGLQYVPPHPCTCYIEEKLNGFQALAPASPQGAVSGQPSAQLVRGPVYGQASNPKPGTQDPKSEWSAFRHDSMRTGAVDTQVPDGLAPVWRVRVGTKVSAPIVAAGKLFAALTDEHQVVCLDAADGKQLWAFIAGGRVDSPPTYHNGTVLFGSADGWVYCLRADDGQLVWRFRAAPEERLIGAYGQLESAWPVPGSVLVQEGVAYFVAGRTSELDGGLYLFGVDAATGETRCHTRMAGPDYYVNAAGKLAVRPEEGAPPENADATYDDNFRLPMGSLPDILVGDGTTLYMRSVAFDGELKRKPGRPDLQVRSGLLDDTYFKRTPWNYDGNYANLLAHDSNSVYYIRQFDPLQGLSPTVLFTPGSKGYLLFGKNLGGKSNTWMERVPVRVRAMVLTTGRLFVAGPPDVVDPKDPLGAFEGRKGGLLYAIDCKSGDRATEYQLPSPPVFNGAAAANSRLYVVEEDGSVTCLARG